MGNTGRVVRVHNLAANKVKEQDWFRRRAFRGICLTVAAKKWATLSAQMGPPLRLGYGMFQCSVMPAASNAKLS